MARVPIPRAPLTLPGCGGGNKDINMNLCEWDSFSTHSVMYITIPYYSLLTSPLTPTACASKNCQRYFEDSSSHIPQLLFPISNIPITHVDRLCLEELRVPRGGLIDVEPPSQEHQPTLAHAAFQSSGGELAQGAAEGVTVGVPAGGCHSTD